MSMVGGWRFGREQKLRTFGTRPAGSLPGVFVSAIHATPAPMALRNFPRVSFVLEDLFVARLPGLRAARLESTENRSSLKRRYTRRAFYFGSPLLLRVGFFRFTGKHPSHRCCDPVGIVRTDDETAMKAGVYRYLTCAPTRPVRANPVLMAVN